MVQAEGGINCSPRTELNLVGVTLLADFHWSIGTNDKVTQLVKDAATFCKSSYGSSTALSLLGSIFPADTFWVAFVAYLDALGVSRLRPGGIFRAAACVLENAKADPHWNPFPYRFNRRPFMEYRGKKLGKGKRELGAQKLKSIKGHWKKASIEGVPVTRRAGYLLPPSHKIHLFTARSTNNTKNNSPHHCFLGASSVWCIVRCLLLPSGSKEASLEVLKTLAFPTSLLYYSGTESAKH